MNTGGRFGEGCVQSFEQARRLLMENYDHPDRLMDFSFPEVVNFNWAHDWFDAYSLGRGDIAVAGPSLSGQWQEVSYQLLARTSQQVSAALLRDGVSSGDRILIDMTATIELYAVLLGIVNGHVIPQVEGSARHIIPHPAVT